MLTYEEFKDILEKEFKNYLKPEYQDMEIQITRTEKVNEVLDGVYLSENTEQNKTKISPIMYIKDMYENYKNNRNMDMTLTKAAQELCKHYENIPDIVLDFNNFDDKILFQIINKEQNMEMLKDMPYREYQDLAITYYITVNMNDNFQNGIIKINNAVADILGKNEEQLYELAYDNTRKILEPSVYSMKEIMQEILRDSDIPEELIKEMTENEFNDEMWVISNRSKYNGAVSMVYDDILQQLSEKVDDNLYIMPSSIHEVIAVPATNNNADELSKMVRQINMNEVDISDRLSNEVYSYDKDKRELTLVTDNPDKSIEYDKAYQNIVKREWNDRII